MCKASCWKIIESLYFKRGTRNSRRFSARASGNLHSCCPSPGHCWPCPGLFCPSFLALAGRGCSSPSMLRCHLWSWPWSVAGLGGGWCWLLGLGLWLGGLRQGAHVAMMVQTGRSLPFLRGASRGWAPEMGWAGLVCKYVGGSLPLLGASPGVQ